MQPIVVGTDNGLVTLAANGGRRLAGQRIDWLEHGARGLLAIVDGARVYDLSAGVELATVADNRANCLLNVAGSLLIGGAGATLSELRDGVAERRRDFDEAPGRDEWFTPWGGPPDVRSMAADRDGSIYVNVHVGGVLVWRSSDPVWRDTMDIRADVHQVTAHPQQEAVVLAATAWGLAVSFDGAASWEFRTDGLHGTYCRAVTVAGDTVYVSASQGSTGQAAAVYRTSLSGGPLERVAGGIPEWFSDNVDTGCLAAAGELVAIGDRAGSVFFSTDAGRSFDAVAKMGSVTAVAITPDGFL